MREKENLTLLGNQQNNYETDYNPGLLETLQGSLISQTLLFRMSQAREWWKARA